ncbi:MAG: PAS domain S-box protein [Magnetococcales bacterium]|nr:PAS domain S-box protein [Magnetococcales bacterium]NGZ25855.1 PAS domain S-box protein [Magnetococcales bacterium]
MLNHFATHSLLTVKMVVITLLVSAGVWLLLDDIQTHGLKETFLAHHSHEFEHSARVNRFRLDHHLRKLPELAELVVGREGMQEYIEASASRWATEDILQRNTLPEWNPGNTLLRSYPLPKIWMLLDKDKQVKEIYSTLAQALPEALRQPSPLLLKLSNNQHYLTLLEDTPYLITSRGIPYHKEEERATLLLATPMDGHFLSSLLWDEQVTNSIIILTDANRNGKIVASSAPDFIPIGSLVSDHKDNYTIGNFHILDYGDSELLLQFGTLAPREELGQMIEKLFHEERSARLIMGISMLLSFLVIMILLTRRITALNLKVKEFARKELGESLALPPQGDPLVVLEDLFHDLIGKIKTAQQTLQDNARELEAVVANVADGIIVIDEESQIIAMNPAGEKIFQTTETLPFPLTDLMPQEFHHQHLGGVKRLQETGISHILDRPIEVPGLRKDGSRRLLDLHVSAMAWKEHHHFIGIVRDITERKDAELALKASEERFRLLVNLIPHGVEECTTEGVITFSNPARNRMLEMEEDQLIGTTVFDHFSEEGDRRQLVHYLSQLVAHQPPPTPYFGKNRTQSGKMIDVQVDWAYKRDASGQLIGFVSIITDVTEKLAATRRIREQQEALAHVQRLQTMGNIASGIAHELNQPLAAILNYARGCSRRLRSNQWDYHEILAVVDRIGEQAERVGLVMQNLRGFLSKGKINPMLVELTQVVRDAVEFMDYETRRHGVAVRFRTDESTHPVVVDTIQIQQVIQNLMRNAIEAMLESDQELRVLDMSIACYDKDTVRLVIQDTGPGIDPRLVGELFCPFFTTKPDGMGLGLSISQSIIEHHGGRLWFENSKEGGAIFGIHLPMGSGRAS